MDKIRLLTNGGYGNVVCKPGDVLEVSEWFDTACEAYVPSVGDHLYFSESEFELLDDNFYYVVFVEYYGLDYGFEETVHVSQPSTYDEALDKKHQAMQSKLVKNARICRLTFLD